MILEVFGETGSTRRNESMIIKLRLLLANFSSSIAKKKLTLALTTCQYPELVQMSTKTLFDERIFQLCSPMYKAECCKDFIELNYTTLSVQSNFN